MWQELLNQIQNGNSKALARSITLIENDFPGAEELLKKSPVVSFNNIIGITGPPGAGKSTLVDALIEELVQQNKKVGVLCVDPSSPFNLGALLGDRIRMSEWYTHPNVFIRSLATRGSMGGLHPKIIELTDLLKAAGFDYIIVETVGVGQSEIEITGLADTTVVVLVPEAGDEVQTMKAGLMEIADIFVVNKSDRPDAELFVKNLRSVLQPGSLDGRKETPVVKTIASQKKGIKELLTAITAHNKAENETRKLSLLTEKAWHLVQQRRMKDLTKEVLREKLKEVYSQSNFNLYSFIEKY